MCNAVRDHVGTFVLWISNPRQAEWKTDTSGSIYLILVPEQKFVEKIKNFGKYERLSLKKVNSKLLWTEWINRYLSPCQSYCVSERHHFRSLFRHHEFSDTNICHPTVYQRHHSVPRSVTRHRAVGIRLVKHSAGEI